MGVGVGTAGARAGVFDEEGRLVGTAKHDISMFREAGSIIGQSFDEIWVAACDAARRAFAEAGTDPAKVQGLGFDASRSLVVLGEGGVPLPVGPSDDPERNVIVWMDHRAVDQAERVNATGHRVLDYIGGRISPEMETPKLRWLKENRPDAFGAAWQFFDLTDLLAWRATGSLARSICTLTCKWTDLGHEARWDERYFDEVGLVALVAEPFRRIGTEAVDPGTAPGTGLTEAAAGDLGLVPGTRVAAGPIDAHSSGIGTVGTAGPGGPQTCLGQVLAYRAAR